LTLYRCVIVSTERQPYVHDGTLAPDADLNER